MKILVPLAQGFEEIEAVTIIDVLRRADLDVTTAHVGGNPVCGSHNIKVTADTNISAIKADDFGCIVLPGGMPGSTNLKNSSAVISLLKNIYSGGGYIAAICAAPIVLGHAGLLHGKKATCYPGNESQLTGATIVNEPVVIDGKIITGKGPGCAIPFALELVGILKNHDKKIKLKNAMQVYWM